LTESSHAIVVVLNASEHREEGLYIYIPISSYLPQSGPDGFVVEEWRDDVYKFVRQISRP